MTPSEYVYTYLYFYSWVYDRFVVTQVKNYLQSGKGNQSTRAQAAYLALRKGLNKQLGRPGSELPATFEMEGYTVISTSLWRVFNGKGAPDEIQDVLWLAAVCGLVTPSTVRSYVDDNLGIDCGGFVANYWGMGHPVPGNYSPTGATGFKPRYIWGMNQSLRRRRPEDIRVGDAAIFFQDVKGDNPDVAAKQKADGSYDTTSGSQAYHIGLVSDVSCAAGTSQVTLEIAESSGATAESGGSGVNVRSAGTATARVAGGYVYFPAGNDRIYFAGPAKAPNPYLPYTWDA